MLDLTSYSSERVEWPLVGAAMVALTVLFYIFCFLSARIWRAVNLNYHDQWEWSMRCISIAHSSVVSAAALYWIHLFYTQGNHAHANLRGAFPYAGYVSDFSIGYFLWDLVACTTMDRCVARHWASEQAALSDAQKRATEQLAPEAKKKALRAPRPYLQTVEIIHHLVAFSGQVFSLGDAGLPLMYVTLLGTECTTPFLNLLWLQDQARTPKPLFYATAVAFLLLWIVFRLGFCGFASYYMYSNLEAAWALVPPNSFYYCVVTIPFLSVLNWFWFWKILNKFLCPRDDKHTEVAATAAAAGGSAADKSKQQ